MPNKKELTPQLAAFVEQLAELFDRSGHQRIGGRLLGYLLVCDPPYQSAAELQEVSGASKASVSINLRLLQAAGMVERVGVPGERRAHYQIRIEAWTQDLRAKTAEIATMRKIADNGLMALSDAPPERRQRLEAMREFYAFCEAAFPELLDQWEARNAKR